jgi:hypothetical protein
VQRPDGCQEEVRHEGAKAVQEPVKEAADNNHQVCVGRSSLQHAADEGPDWRQSREEDLGEDSGGYALEGLRRGGEHNERPGELEAVRGLGHHALETLESDARYLINSLRDDLGRKLEAEEADTLGKYTKILRVDCVTLHEGEENIELRLPRLAIVVLTQLPDRLVG